MNEVPEVRIDDAKKKFDRQDCVFVDIRDPGSYRAAHIPGAVHLHDGNVQKFVEDADKNREVIVYCYHGNSSLGAVAYFLQNGFTNVASMRGGFEAWRQAYEYEAG
jgi:thiosulfate sulfurtransferase